MKYIWNVTFNTSAIVFRPHYVDKLGHDYDCFRQWIFIVFSIAYTNMIIIYMINAVSLSNIQWKLLKYSDIFIQENIFEVSFAISTLFSSGEKWVNSTNFDSRACPGDQWFSLIPCSLINFPYFFLYHNLEFVSSYEPYN